ncbi:prepilin peptidase [Candidatus Vallotiella sp. (ex Adelges kitamiensis)]|uniref:prepilin peptidase n=1 Tax=Candidatus Vallotiella sp. (ex Adelges kitamiensis) TaxID=2864217 RepID=UPI001CE365B3|nr:A24 family peptidase [Candidatus Vallotia sp. (ex Adelges kitamiensis)]
MEVEHSSVFFQSYYPWILHSAWSILPCFRYLLIEYACTLLAAFSLATFGPTPAALAAFAFCTALLAISAIDLKSKLLPDMLTLPLLWAGLLVNLHAVFSPLNAAVIGAAAGYILLWIVQKLFKLVRGVEGIGYGDLKLFSAIGAWFGWSSLFQVILVATLCSSIIGLEAILSKRMRLEDPLPFGPFLSGSAVLKLFGVASLYPLIGS